MKKTGDDYISANEAQYNPEREREREREAAKISTLSTVELEKYYHLTGKDLRHKSGVVGKSKFEYSQLNKCFNKGSEKKDKKERLLKRF